MASQAQETAGTSSRCISVWDTFVARAPRAITADVGAYLLVSLVVYGLSTIVLALAAHGWPQLLAQCSGLLGSIDPYLLLAVFELVSLSMWAINLWLRDPSVALLPSIVLFVPYVVLAEAVVVVWSRFLFWALGAATGSDLALVPLSSWAVTHLQHPLAYVSIATLLVLDYLGIVARCVVFTLSLAVEVCRGRVSLTVSQEEAAAMPEVDWIGRIRAWLGQRALH